MFFSWRFFHIYWNLHLLNPKSLNYYLRLHLLDVLSWHFHLKSSICSVHKLWNRFVYVLCSQCYCCQIKLRTEWIRAKQRKPFQLKTRRTISWVTRYAVELLNSIPGNTSMPEHRLTLKPDFFVMLLHNLQPTNSYVNGAWYIIESMISNVLRLHFVYERRNSKLFILPRALCDPADEYFLLPGFCKTQFLVLFDLQSLLTKCKDSLSVENVELIYITGGLHMGSCMCRYLK